MTYTGTKFTKSLVLIILGVYMKKIMTMVLVISTAWLLTSCATVASISKRNITENNWISNYESWQATPNEAQYAQTWVDDLMDYDAIKYGYENGYDIIMKDYEFSNKKGTWVHRYQTSETTPFSVYTNGGYINGRVTTTYNHVDTYPAVDSTRRNHYSFLKGDKWTLPENVEVINVNEKNVKDYYERAKYAYNRYYNVGYHVLAEELGHYLCLGWVYKMIYKPTLPKDLRK